MPLAAFAANLLAVTPGIELSRPLGPQAAIVPPCAYEPSMQFVAALSMTPNHPPADTLSPQPLRQRAPRQPRKKLPEQAPTES